MGAGVAVGVGVGVGTGVGRSESAPVGAREAGVTELADLRGLADFTPLSDDLLPRLKTRA